MRTSAFWEICFGLFCCGFGVSLLGTQGVLMLIDHGFDAFTRDGYRADRLSQSAAWGAQRSDSTPHESLTLRSLPE
jgi:hypothetical protein